jgi:integrase/recombinase XerC
MSPITLDGFDTYITVELGLSRQTLSAYMHDAKEFLDFIGEGKLTQYSIPTFIDQLRTRNLAATTIRRKYMAVRCLCHHLVSLGHITSNIFDATDSVRIDGRTPYALEAKNIDDLLSVLDSRISEPRATNVRRNIAIVLTMYDSGLRVSEVCGLNLPDISIEKRSIRVSGKGGRDRVVPTTKRCVSSIQSYCTLERKTTTTALFVKSDGDRVTRRAVGGMLTCLSHKAKITHTTAQTLRRSCATHLMNNGMELSLVQTMLGHQHISTTQAYLAVNKDRLVKIHRRCHPLGSENAKT